MMRKTNGLPFIFQKWMKTLEVMNEVCISSAVFIIATYIKILYHNDILYYIAIYDVISYYMILLYYTYIQR